MPPEFRNRAQMRCPARLSPSSGPSATRLEAPRPLVGEGGEEIHDPCHPEAAPRLRETRLHRMLGASMRYPLKIATAMRPLFWVFGFRPDRCYIDMDDTSLELRFGSIQKTIPLADVSGAAPRDWPLYYGLGNKLGPEHGVAYVGSFDGVVHITFSRPHDLQVWGPIRRSDARGVTVSLQDSEAFLEALHQRISAAP